MAGETDEEPEWRQYERYIYEKLIEWGGDDATVEFDVKLPGRFSGALRQVDALVTGGFGGKIQEGVKAAVDCKCYSRNVDIKDVEAFMGLVEDVDVALGILVTTQGYSEAARQRGTGGIHLRVVRRVLVAAPDDLPSGTHSPGHDEPYYEGDYFDHAPQGRAGAVVSFARPYGEFTDGVHPQDLEWETDTLVVGNDDEVSWGENEPRERVSRLVLEHHLGAPPEDDVVQAFLNSIAWQWEDGQPWVVYVGELRYHLGI